MWAGCACWTTRLIIFQYPWVSMDKCTSCLCILLLQSLVQLSRSTLLSQLETDFQFPILFVRCIISIIKILMPFVNGINLVLFSLQLHTFLQVFRSLTETLKFLQLIKITILNNVFSLFLLLGKQMQEKRRRKEERQ